VKLLEVLAILSWFEEFLRRDTQACVKSVLDGHGRAILYNGIVEWHSQMD